MAPQIWVIHKGEHWEVQDSEEEFPLAVYDDKVKAIEVGRKVAKEKEGDLVVQLADYSIDWISRSGDEPRPRQLPLRQPDEP